MGPHEFDSKPREIRVRTCRHLLNGEYSVSIFDNGDAMCKVCASEMIANPSWSTGTHVIEMDGLEVYHHLKKLYDEKAGPYDPDYPSNYLKVLDELVELPQEYRKLAAKLASD